ncbi:MAG: Rrf2 family transcriptional regulator, partial [Halorubrum sp.]
MSRIQLSSSQERVLTALVNLSEGREAPVQGREIADAIDRNAGTVRNRMGSLSTLGLVEGVAGPDGGYIPTDEAYETLGIERLKDAATTPVEREGDPVEDVT